MYLMVTGACFGDTIPSAASGCRLWFSGDSGISLSGSAVSGWSDRSGNAFNATAANSSMTMGSIGPHSRPAVKFSNSAESKLSLSSAALSAGNNPYTCIGVVQIGAWQDWQFWFSAGTPSFCGDNIALRFAFNENLDRMTNSWYCNDYDFTLANQAGVNHVVSFDYSGSTRSHRRHGELIGSQSFTGFNLQPNHPSYIGGSYDTGNCFDGVIAELIVLNRTLTENESAAIHSYLGAKYALGKDTSATPTVNGAGVYVLGTSNNVAISVISAPTVGSLSTTVTNSNPGGTFSGTTATSNDGTVINPDVYSTSKYWTITGMSDTTYAITFDISGMTGVSDVNKLVILKRADSSSAWTPLNTTKVDSNYLTATGVTGFSDFTIGSSSAYNQLPVNVSSYELE